VSDKAFGNLLYEEARQAGVTFAWSEVCLHGIWVEAKWTDGRGKAKGKSYLHIRKEVPLVIVEKQPDGTETRTEAGTTFVHLRVAPNGEIKEL